MQQAAFQDIPFGQHCVPAILKAAFSTQCLYPCHGLLNTTSTSTTSICCAWENTFPRGLYCPISQT